MWERPIVLLSVLGLLSSCASREYVTNRELQDVRVTDPELRRVRVYPNVSFVAVYQRHAGDVTDVSTAGTLENDTRGEVIAVSVRRRTPGALVDASHSGNAEVLWVSFDETCAERSCAFGFVRARDGLYRLHRVPSLRGYGAPRVYRRTMSARHRMARTKLYARAGEVEVYRTVRGFAASVGLEIKRRDRVEVDFVEAPQPGVRPGR